MAFICGCAAPAWAQGPTLVPATLRNISPNGVRRGQPVTLTFDGLNISRAEAVVFDDPAITGTVKAGGNANLAMVAAEIGDGARIGIHRAFLRTPLGTTAGVTFAVGGWPEVKERVAGSPQERPATLPATFVGTISRAGERDPFLFRAEAGQQLVFQVVAGEIRSRLQSVLTLTDARGTVLAEQDGDGGSPDAVLTYRFADAGDYVIQIRDFENAAGGDVTYRLNAGPFAHATSVFPLGFRKGQGQVTLSGANLGQGQSVTVTGEQAGWGSAVTVADSTAGPLLSPVRVAVGDEPEALEAEPNNDAAAAQTVALPVTVNGKIAGSGAKADGDYFRFRAKKGQELVLEVNARRLGSPLDSVLEVLDTNGKPIERATLRCVAETITTLNDRDSATNGLRLLAWNDLAMNDLVYVRGEVIQITLLPQGPDEDTRFRAVGGQRVGFFDTTPTGIAQNTSVYKVQVHPPGSKFSPNGMPVFRLYYRNDDGGPLYGKDSRVMFTAPADGEYLARISDVRGTQSDHHAYRLTIRDRRPDFRLALNPAHPGIPAGSSMPVEVSVDRFDGFDGPVRVALDGLPSGVAATPAVIEAGEVRATLVLTASPTAASAAAELRLTGEAVVGGQKLVRSVSPGGGRSYITVLPKADLSVRTDLPRITIRPGQEQYLEASIERQNGFEGRVPIDLKNLPYGVRVLDIGLNGVLITESLKSRRFTVYCEPWVKPMQRTIYCTVRTETGSGAPTEVAATPIMLEVLPPVGPKTASGVR